MKKKVLTVLLSLTLLFSTACASGAAGSPSGTDPVSAAESQTAETSNGNQEDSGDVQVVNVGTMGTYEPFSYVDEDGRATGYDIELLYLIEEVDPSLKFEIHTGPWDSLFPGLDADKYQLLANQITSNPDRVEKYLLTENTYHICVSQLIVQEGRTDINSLEDLEGKSIGTTIGDSHTRALEDWNAENGDILDIVYYEEDVTTLLQDVVTGRIDATINDPIMATAKAEAQGLAVKAVGERIVEDPTHFIIKKDEQGQALLAKIDSALAQLHEDGRLSALSIEWFGQDYTK